MVRLEGRTIRESADPPPRHHLAQGQQEQRSPEATPEHLGVQVSLQASSVFEGEV